MFVAIITGLLGGWLTNIGVSLYLHRSLAHGSVTLHPLVTHPIRLLIWLSTGMVAREWVAVHRKHHAFSDQPGDPHSPIVFGIWAILLKGVWFYRKAAMDPEVIRIYGKGCPDDWIERHLYSRFPTLGIFVWIVPCIAVFGPLAGMACWLAQVTWTPIWAAGVINGIGHYLGYRNFTVNNHATNLSPVGVWIGGEELHNNHHRFPRSAKFAFRPWEFDFIWCLVRCLKAFRLADDIYVHNKRYHLAKVDVWLRKMETRMARWTVAWQQLQTTGRRDLEIQRRELMAHVTAYVAQMEKRFTQLGAELRPHWQARFNHLVEQLQGLHQCQIAPASSS